MTQVTLTYWHGNGTWLVLSWVVFVPDMNIIHNIGNISIEWPWRYRSRSEVIVCDTPSHASDHLCQIWKEYIQKCMCYRVGMQDVPYFSSFIANFSAERPGRYRWSSNVIMCDTPTHASDHWCLIWKEFIHNCRIYRVDIARYAIF